MDEQVIQDLYNRAVSLGYKKSKDEFISLLHSDASVQTDNYTYVKNKGYKKSMNDFLGLVGAPATMETAVEKKSPDGTTMVSESAGFSSGFPSQQSIEIPSIEKQIEKITPDFVEKNEEFVVPQMKAQFGDLGFKFEESGATGDWMTVTAPNGNSTEISLDIDWFSPGNSNDEANRLKNFIRENSKTIPHIQQLEKQYADNKKIFTTQEEVDSEIQKMNQSADQFKNETTVYLTDKVSVDQELNNLNKIKSNTAEYNAKRSELMARKAQLDQRFIDLSNKQQEIIRKSDMLKQSVGKYTMMKQEQGTWMGATVDWLAEGFSGMSASAVSNIVDLMFSKYTGGVDEEELSKQVTDNLATGNVEEDAKDNVAISNAYLLNKNNSASIPMPAAGQSYKDWWNSLSSDQKTSIVDKSNDQIKKDVKKNLLPAVREGNEIVWGDDDTSVEWRKLQEEGFWGGAYAGLVKSLPAMIGSNNALGWAQRTAQMYGQTTDAIMSEMEKSPEFDNISESEKQLIVAPIGVASAALESIGLRNIVANKGLMNRVILGAMGKAGATTTAKTFGDLVKNEVNSMVAKGALTLTGAALAEAETGAAQQIVEYGAKEIYNMMKERDLFQTPDFLSAEYIKDIAKAGAQEAVGGFVLGMPSAVSAAYSKKGYLGMDNVTFKAFESFANDSKLQSAFIVELKNKVATGMMTNREAKEMLNNYRNSVGLFRELPDNLDTESKKEAMNLLKERRDLEQQISGKEEALVQKQKNRINEINNELTNISNRPSASAQTTPSGTIIDGTRIQVAPPERDTEVLNNEETLADALNNIDDQANDEVAFLDENDNPLDVRENRDRVAQEYFDALEAENNGQTLTQSQLSAKTIVDRLFGERTRATTDASWANDLDDNTEYELNFQSEQQIPIGLWSNASDNQNGTFTVKAKGSDIKNEFKRDLVDSFNDDQMYTFDFNSMEEVPDEYRINVREIPAIEAQRKLFGVIPMGKSKVFRDKIYRVSISGADAKKLKLQPQRAANQAQIFRNTAKSLASIFPDLKIVSLANMKEMRDYALQNFNQDVADTITGSEGGMIINDASGKPIAILINEETSITTTMPHEAWHAILVKAFGENPALFEEFKNGIEKALRDNGMTQIIDALDNFSNQEEYINSNMQAEEWLVELGGLLTSAGITYDNLTPKAKSLLTQIKAVFNSIAIKITGQPMFLEDATPEDMLDFMVTISDRMARGMSLNEFFRDTAPSSPAGAGVSSKTQAKKQIVGENAKLSNEIKADLQVAKDMADADQDAKTIRIATGWEKGADGKWRYETVDNLPIFQDTVRLIKEFILVNKTNQVKAKGSDILSDDLIKMYPELADIDVILSNKGDDEGSWNANTNTIRVKLNLRTMDTVSTLLHEIQHAIQDIEGFERGSNLYQAESYRVDEMYNELMNEDEEFQNLFKRSLDIYNQLKKVKNSSEELKLEKEGRSLGDRMNQIVVETYGEQNFFDVYERFAGEVEARNVEARKKMTAEERRQTPLAETEDVDREKQILVKKQIPAYHGSPRDFDKFTTEKMGTGEGNQAFGWGLYFTDLKSIANHYKTALSKKKVKELWIQDGSVEGEAARYNEKAINTSDPDLAFTYEERANFLNELNNTFDYKKSLEVAGNSEDLKKWADKNVLPFVKDDLGVLYEVSLHEGKTPDQYTWLEWDKPLTKNQIQTIIDNDIDGTIQDAIYNYLSENFDITTVEELIETIDNQEFTGKELYNIISSNTQDATPKSASIALLNAGIDGIKYPAESISRGTTSETAKGFNYVVFDENAITVKNKVKFQRPTGNDLLEVQKIGQRYNINDKGFMPKQANEFALAKEIARFGLGAKRSKVTPEGYGGSVYMTDPAGKFFNPFKVKKHRVSLSGGKLNPNVNTIEGYDRMMEQVQNIIDKSERRGVAKDKIMQNVMEYVTKSKVYERANDSQREQLVRNIETEFGKTQKSAPSVGKILGTIKNITKITLPEKELLKQHFRDLAKGARDAKRAFMQASDDLSLTVSELAKSGKISPKQLSDVIRKFSKVNMLNEDSTNAFVDYMTKVFEDADYAEKIAGIRTKITKARGNLKSKIGVADAIANPMRKLLAVNPTLIPDDVFDKYLNIINMFSASQAVLPLKDISDISQDINDIFQSLDEQLSKSEELAIRFNDFLDKVVNEENGKIQYADTVNKMEKDGIVTAEEAELMKKYKSVIFPKEQKEAKTAAEIKAENNLLIKAITAAKINLDRLTLKDERELADNIRRLLKPELLNQLTTAQLTNLIKLIDNINNGFMPHYGELAFEGLNAIKNSTPVGEATLAAKLLPLTKIYNNLKSKLTKRTSTSEMVRSGGFFFIDQILGNFKAKVVFNALFEKISEANAVFTSQLGQVNKKLDSAKDAVVKSFNYDANKTLESSFRMMAYMIQLEYESNPGNKQVNPASAYIKETIKAIKRGKTMYGDKEIEMLERILDENGNVDKDALYNSFNKAEKNAIKTIREINDGLTEKAVYTAAVIRGQRIDALNNYIHLPVMSEYNPDESAVATKVMDEYNSTMNPSTKGKNLIERTSGAKAINFDVFASAQRGAKFTLLDYHMTTPIRTARKTLNEVENRYGDEFTKQQREIFNAIRDGFEEVVSNVLTNNFMSNSTSDEVIIEISKQGYRAVLGSAFRFVAEFLSNIGFVMVAGKKSFIEGVKYFSVFSSPDGVKIMENVSSKQITRLFHGDTLSGKFIDTSMLNQASGVKSATAKGTIANKANQIYNMSLKKYKNGVELIADTLISTPDRVVMRPVWFGQFATEFKKQSGKDVDFKKIAENNEAYMRENKDAIEAAKLRADEMSVLAGATDNPFMGMVKGTTKPNQGSITKLFNMFNGYMTRFALFEYTTARQGIYAAMGNGSISRSEGIALLAAVTTRMTLYTFLINAAAGGLAGLLGDEEEEDEKTLMQKVGRAFASTASSLLLGRNFGNATKSLISVGVEEFNEAFLDDLRNGKYDPYKDAISSSAVPKDKKGGDRDLSDLLANMLGPFSPSYRATDLIVRKALAKEKKEPEAIKRSEQENMIRIPLEVLGNAGMIPLYKDVRREVMNELYKDLRNADKKAEDKKQAEKEMLHGYENREDMKRYDPELYDKVFGKDSPGYDAKEAKRKLKREMDAIERRKKDEFYDYVPKKKEKKKGGFESEKMGSGGFGTNKMGSKGFESEKMGSKGFGE
jgi:hypothetical protein